MNKTLLKNARIIDPFGEKEFIENGYLTLAGEVIETVGAGGYRGPDCGQVIDLEGKTVLPGMIDAHTHLYSALALGMPPPAKYPANFVEILEEIWWKLDRALDDESNRASFEAGLLECLRAGVTTVFDHHSSQNCIAGSLDLLAETANRFGVGVSSSFEITDRNGSPGFEAGLTENLRSIRKYSGNTAVVPLMGLHASFTLSDDSLRKIGETMQGLATGIHVHAAEDVCDQEDVIGRGYRSVISRLNKFGLLNEKSLVVHGLYLNKKDLEVLKDRGSVLVHCPSSNANNHVGIIESSPVRMLKGALGTDGMQANMLSESKEGSLIRSSQFAESDSGIDYLRLLFKHNPDLAGRFFHRKIGHLAPGYQADLAVYDYRERSALNAGNYSGHLLYGLDRPSDVITRGKFRIKNGGFTDFDEPKIRANSVRQSKRLWQKMLEM